MEPDVDTYMRGDHHKWHQDQAGREEEVVTVMVMAVVEVESVPPPHRQEREKTTRGKIIKRKEDNLCIKM